jgi:cobalt-precorrin 5A hydrolase
VVRDIAPLLDNKWSDPAVVVVDSNLSFAIPLLGGHHGANEVARKISELGAIPVLTTATEVHGKPSVEGIADRLGCQIFNKESTVAVNCALLDQDVEVLEVKGPKIVVVDENVSVLVRNRQETAKVKGSRSNS